LIHFYKRFATDCMDPGLETGEEEADIGGKTSVFAAASEQACHNVSVPLFAAKDYLAGLATQYDEIIDVRTPLEFEEDHMFGAINLPVLSNEQRVQVGTLYHKDRMAGRKLGAALITANISKHILEHFTSKAGNYRPLVYCWRGGQRSRSMALILREIGFQAAIFQGGYKEYRQLVRETVQESELRNRIDEFKFILMSGTTGSGKSLILETLEKRGEQMIHLELLARHKGSVLGNYPGEVQPSQKLFESQLFHLLQFQMDPSKVVWLEYESFKIGNITVPKKLSNKMLVSDRVHIEATLDDRVTYILQDYSYICADPEALKATLRRLDRLAGKKVVDSWRKLVDEGQFEQLVRNLVVDYYDRCYRIPRGEALEVFHLPGGLILDKIALLNSALVGRLIDLGESHLSQNQTESFPNQNQNEKQLSDSVTAGVQHGMERPAAQ